MGYNDQFSVICIGIYVSLEMAGQLVPFNASSTFVNQYLCSCPVIPPQGPE